MKTFTVLFLLMFLLPINAQETDPAGDLYNQAVAAVNAQDTPRGLLLLRRALLVSPRDPDIQNALNQIRLALEMDNADGFSLMTLGNITHKFITFEELSIIVWGCWITASFIAMLYISQRQRSWLTRGTLIVLLTLSASGGVLLTLRQRVDATDAVVLQAAIPRSGPGMDYLPLTLLTAGSEINITGEKTDWLQFRSNIGTTGWLLSNDTTFVIPRG